MVGQPLAHAHCRGMRSEVCFEVYTNGDIHFAQSFVELVGKFCSRRQEGQRPGSQLLGGGHQWRTIRLLSRIGRQNTQCEMYS